jgi:hypothetical protein
MKGSNLLDITTVDQDEWFGRGPCKIIRKPAAKKWGGLQPCGDGRVLDQTADEWEGKTDLFPAEPGIFCVADGRVFEARAGDLIFYHTEELGMGSGGWMEMLFRPRHEGAGGSKYEEEANNNKKRPRASK